MATELLTIGTTAAQSADIVIADGTTATIFLKGTGGIVPWGAKVKVEVKDASGAYNALDELNANKTSGVLSSGTWRLNRIYTGNNPVGAERA